LLCTEASFPPLLVLHHTYVITSLIIVRLFRLIYTTQVGLNFMTYELVRKYLTPEGDKNPSAVRKLAAGAISGAVAQTCTYPL